MPPSACLQDVYKRQVAVCTSGGQVLSAADCLNGGIVVSGYRFEDMMYDELHQCLPGDFDMLLILSLIHI